MIEKHFDYKLQCSCLSFDSEEDRDVAARMIEAMKWFTEHGTELLRGGNDPLLPDIGLGEPWMCHAGEVCEADATPWEAILEVKKMVEGAALREVAESPEGHDVDAEIHRIINLSDAEIEAEIKARGEDPKVVAAWVREVLETAIRKCKPPDGYRICNNHSRYYWRSSDYGDYGGYWPTYTNAVEEAHRHALAWRRHKAGIDNE